MATLDIIKATKSFGPVQVLQDINISIGDGDFLVLVGPSGCGKSTLLNIIAGLLDLTSGSLQIDRREVSNLEPRLRDIAMVFQSYALYPAMTVAKNIAFPLRMAGKSRAEQEARTNEVADLLQIRHLLDRKPQALSGGQRQRVAMGRALVRDPKIFLFDEPLSNLDAKLRVDMRTEIKKLHQRLRTTIVYVTHDQVEAMTMATKIAVMKDGLVQQFGAPEEIYSRPANTFVATFMGSPAMNLLAGAIGPDARTVRIGAITLPLPASAGPVQPGQEVFLGVRPEYFALLEDGQPGQVVVAAEVEVLEPTGPDLYALLRLGTDEVMTRLPANASLQPGQTRRFALDMEKTVLFDKASTQALYAGPR